MIRALIFGLFLTGLVYGQSETDSIQSAAVPTSLPETRSNLETLQSSSINSGGGMVRTFDNRQREVEGTPYLFNDFRAATVILVDGQILTGPARYNAYTHQVEFRQEGTNLQVLAGQIRALRFEVGTEDKPLALNQRQLSLGGPRPLPALLYETLHEGQAMLLKLYAKEYKTPEVKAIHPSGKTTDQYLDKAQYYLRVAGAAHFIQIRLAKGPLLKALPEEAVSRAKKFIKSEKLRLNQEEDVVRLLRHLEEEE